MFQQRRHHRALGGSTIDFTGQVGLLTGNNSISEKFDYANDRLANNSYTVNGNNVTPNEYTDPLDFGATEQAIIKFTLQDKANNAAVSPSALSVTDGTNTVELTSIPTTTYTANGDGVLYVAFQPSGENKTITLTATVGSDTYTYTTPTAKTFYRGWYYEITVKMTKLAPLASSATTGDIGKLIGSDGRIYSTQAAATAANTTAVAMIAYVGNESNCSNGLAIALENVGNGNTWDSAAGLCNAWNESTSPKKVTGGTWRLPTIIDWQYMFIGCGASGSVEDNPTVGYSMSYSGLATKLNAALPASLWSTDGGDTNHWYISFNSDNTATFRKSTNSAGKTPVRACLVF